MTAIKKALDDFANGYEEVTGDMLPKDLRATVKRALLAGVLGFEYDPENMARALLAYGDRTGFLTGLVHSTRIMLMTFNEFQGWFESETQCLAPIYRARYLRSTKAPTGEDLKFLREELEAAKWRFCPDVYGNGVYVFAG
nr:MAG TPA: hypothetical protein [Caudoviricetes sp.]